MNKEKGIAHLLLIFAVLVLIGTFLVIRTHPKLFNIFAEAEGENKVQNSSFENLTNNFPTNWQQRPTASADNTTGYNSPSSLKVVGPEATGAAVYSFQKIKLEPNTKYSLTGYVKTDHVNGSGLSLRYVQIQPAKTYASYSLNGTSDWRKLDLTFTTPADYVPNDNDRLDLVWGLNPEEVAWFDEISLKVVSPVSYDPIPAPGGGGITLNGVPSIDPDYTKDVEDWWSTHLYNPENPNSIVLGGIISPQPVINVKQQFNGDIQAAINSLSEAGGTLFFEPGTYVHNFQIVGKSNIHFISDGGATIVGGPTTSSSLETPSTIAGCTLSVNYGLYDHALIVPDDPQHQAAINCAKNPAKNFYFKNLTFDGGGAAQMALFIRNSRDVLFDNITFQNFVNPLKHHAGPVNTNAMVDNVWFRKNNFVGNQTTAVTLDGVHGGGVINSTIGAGFNSAGINLLTNDDFTADLNGDKKFDITEQRMSNYVVIYNNTFANKNIAVAATAANTLIKNNTVTSQMNYFASFDIRNQTLSLYNDVLLKQPFTYYFYGNKLINNKTTNVGNFFEIGTDPKFCTDRVACAKTGKYTIKDNKVENATTFFKNFIVHTSAIDGPNIVSGNCVNANCNIAAPSIPLSDGLVGYWRMNEGSWYADCYILTSNDYSGLANHGKSCPNQWPDGASLQAMTINSKAANVATFDGVNDYLKIETNSSLVPTNAVTVSTWVNLKSFNGSFPRIISKGGSYDLVLQTSAPYQGRLQWQVRNPNGFLGQVNVVDIKTSSANFLALNTWYNIVTTYDGEASRIYINGVKVAEQTGLGGKTILDSKQPVTIGAQNDGSRNINAQISSTRIYNRSLNESEVSQLYTLIP